MKKIGFILALFLLLFPEKAFSTDSTPLDKEGSGSKTVALLHSDLVNMSKDDTTLTRVELCSDIEKDDWKKLLFLKSMVSLSVEDVNELDDEFFSVLSQLPLKELSLKYKIFSYDSLKNLPVGTLKTLDLSCTPTYSVCVSYLLKCDRLKVLRLNHTHFQEKDLPLFKALKNLERLEAHGITVSNTEQLKKEMMPTTIVFE